MKPHGSTPPQQIVDDGGPHATTLRFRQECYAGEVEVIALIDHVHDADRLPIVILDDRQAISVEPLGMVAALDVEIPAVDRLDVFTQRRLMEAEAELVVCAGRLTEPHPSDGRGWLWPI